MQPGAGEPNAGSCHRADYLLCLGRRQAAQQPKGKTMEIKRSGSQPAGKGPADYFAGSVRIDPLFQAPDPARVLGASVTFEPGARPLRRRPRRRAELGLSGRCELREKRKAGKAGSARHDRRLHRTQARTIANSERRVCPYRYTQCAFLIVRLLGRLRLGGLSPSTGFIRAQAASHTTGKAATSSASSPL